MRALFFSLLSASLLCGCPTDTFIPDGDDTRDFRVEFTSSDASESCGQAVQDEANNFETFSQIYRIWWTEGVNNSNLEVWWKLESESDEDFRFFARGTMAGLLNQGTLEYAGGPFTEGRDDGDVRYTIEGSTTVRFEDELFGGAEEYIISESNSPDAPAGCVYVLSYTGQLVGGTDTAE